MGPRQGFLDVRKPSRSLSCLKTQFCGLSRFLGSTGFRSHICLRGLLSWPKQVSLWVLVLGTCGSGAMTHCLEVPPLGLVMLVPLWVVYLPPRSARLIGDITWRGRDTEDGEN